MARGEAFLLQGGDCAETFAGVTADNVRNKLRVLLQMAVVLTYAASVPVVKVGRIAGSTPPRSSDLETRDLPDGTQRTLPAYRGDAVNGFEFTDTRRSRTRSGWSRSTTPAPRPQPGPRVRHRRVRRPAPGAHLEHRLRARAQVGQKYEAMANEIERALTFMQPSGEPGRVPPGRLPPSHEALVLEYEHAMTRIDSPHHPAVRRLGALRLDRRAHPSASTGPTSSFPEPTSATPSA